MEIPRAIFPSTTMSRRLDISSLLCDEPPSKDSNTRQNDQVVAETVLLAPHLVSRKHDLPRIQHPQYHRPPTEQSLDTLAHAAAHAAALAEKHRDHRSESSFPREPQIVAGPIEDHHRLRTVPHYPAPPSRHTLEQQQLQQQQHQHQLRILQQQEAHQSARQREHHEQMIQQRMQAQLWERERDRGRVADVMGVDLRPGRKSDPGQMRPFTSPSPAHPAAHIAHQQMEPPSKKRRYSDSPGPIPPMSSGIEWERSMSLRHTGDRSILNPEPLLPHPDPPSSVHSVHRPMSSSSQDAAQFGYANRSRVIESVLERHGNSNKIQSPPFLPGRRSPPGSVTGRAKAARISEPDESDVIPPHPPERRVIHVPERAIDEYVVEDRKHRKSHPQGSSRPRSNSRPPQILPVASSSRRPEQDTRSHGPPPKRPQPNQPPTPPKRQPKEEDAHEWLLEQYTDVSPDSQSKRKPAPRISPSPPSTAPPSHTSQSPVQTKKVTSPLVPATMPEAAKALEEELVCVTVAAVGKVEARDDEMDVDLAVSELVEETLEDDKQQEGVQMEVDVEDELLSLVDDQSQPRSLSRVPSGGSKPALRLQTATESESRHTSPVASACSIPPPSERGSMPPPTATVTGQGKSKEPGAMRKKKESAKPAPRPKAATSAKPRAKPAPKARAKASEAGTGPALKGKPSVISRKSGSVAASVSRSRSNSVMPAGSVGPDGSEKPDDEEEETMAAEDDKLYCICKTKYDDNRNMIACDRCDEWYHTQCVDMPDLVVDLVDQFFCPPCIETNSRLLLKTTYKARCRYGLDHPEPDSPRACHKPAQGALSKYCSPECGYNSMKKRIENYTKHGGKKELLWESVKHAQKREAVVIVHEEDFQATATADGCAKANGDAAPAPVVSTHVKPSIGKVEREVASLNAVLDEVVTQREELRKGMDIILWRERLLELANERAVQLGQCGWDQRLCFGEDEWAEFGTGVLESYEEVAKEGSQTDDPTETEEWWCLESEKCERHAGWQTIRAHDIAKEKEMKEEALFRLTTKEREIRKRIEDIVEPFNRSCIDPSTAAPLKPSKLVNGNAKGKTNGDSKKGKKRKNPS
ncbi:hypothetical protein GGX14DRAFT_639073 [Mycena pura]|uniref:PHD-type domain-containing protein n=1 Tax=Mycena pura TaxID=153505 RepID=A0AAD6YP68_9AGAR|nr:hypothetical protein GGX14DRAFT_639073 [Mycena pura]